jgi:chromosome segregation ATPase
MSDVKEAASVLTSENSAEFYANKLGLADTAPTEAADESPAEPVQEVSQSEPEAKTEAEATEQPKKQNPKLEKRFSELSKARDAARQEAANERQQREALETRIRALEQQPQQAAVSTDEPIPENYQDAFDYARDLAKFEARRIIQAEKQAEAQVKAQEAQQKVLSTWSERINEAKSELPDYDEMVASSDVVVHDVIRDAILDSDVGPRILYHLAENEDFAKKFSDMPLPQALKELGKLEARYAPSEDKAVAVRKSKAPPPINPIKGTSGAIDTPINDKGEFTGTIQQWKELRKAGKIR